MTTEVITTEEPPKKRKPLIRRKGCWIPLALVGVLFIIMIVGVTRSIQKCAEAPGCEAWEEARTVYRQAEEAREEHENLVSRCGSWQESRDNAYAKYEERVRWFNLRDPGTTMKDVESAKSDWQFSAREALVACAEADAQDEEATRLRERADSLAAVPEAQAYYRSTLTDSEDSSPDAPEEE